MAPSGDKVAIDPGWIILKRTDGNGPQGHVFGVGSAAVMITGSVAVVGVGKSLTSCLCATRWARDANGLDAADGLMLELDVDRVDGVKEL